MIQPLKNIHFHGDKTSVPINVSLGVHQTKWIMVKLGGGNDGFYIMQQAITSKMFTYYNGILRNRHAFADDVMLLIIEIRVRKHFQNDDFTGAY